MATNHCYIARKNKSDSTYDEGRWWIQNGILGPAPEFVTRQFVDIVGGGFQLESIGTYREVLLKLGIMQPENDKERDIVNEHALAIAQGAQDLSVVPDEAEEEPDAAQQIADPLEGLVVPTEEKTDVQSLLASVAVPPEQLKEFKYKPSVKEMRDAGIKFGDYGMNPQPSKEDAFRAYVLFKGGKI